MEQAETRSIAIAYDWHLPSARWEAYDIALTLARADLHADSSEPAIAVTTYHSKLPPAPSPADGNDVSGTLGVIDPVPDEYPARPRASCAERLLADIVIWELAQLSIDQRSPHKIFIEGPLIPKLRGRLLYRGVAEISSIWSVTWNPEWTHRIAKARGAMEYLEPGSGRSDVLPPEVLDRSSRAWFTNGMHWELLTDPWDCLKTDTLTKHKEEITDVLPPVLALAHQAAADRTRIEQMFTEVYSDYRKKHDSERLREVMPVVERRARHVASPATQLGLLPGREPVRPLLIGQELLLAATKSINWDDPANVYQAFLARQQNLLKVYQSVIRAN